MAKSTFQGPVKSLNGLIGSGPGNVVTLATSTQLTVDDHAGRLIRVNAAAITLTLPLINATAFNPSDGPGFAPSGLNNQGATFNFFITTASTALIITTSGTTDKFYGSIFAGIDAAATGNGTTKGGVVGSFITVTVSSALAWFVSGRTVASGTIVTPFSDS